MKRGPYRQYNKDPSVPVPKASDWRHKKEMEQLIYANQEGNATRNEENIDNSLDVNEESLREKNDLILPQPLLPTALNMLDYTIRLGSPSAQSTPLLVDEDATTMVLHSSPSHLPLSHLSELLPASSHQYQSPGSQHQSPLFEQLSPDLPAFDMSAASLFDISSSGYDMPSISDKDFQQPLYSSAPISTHDSWHAIMKFAIENSLTYRSTEQLLELLNTHCPQPNNLPSSLFILKNRFYQESQHITKMFFCSNCNKEVPPQQQCSERECRHKNVEVCQYFILDFEEDLQKMYEVQWEQLQYPFQRQRNSGIIEDIQDGSVINDLMKPGEFLSIPEHAGLIVNTDGVQPFHASKHSIWPVYLMVCNLPPNIRMNEKFILLAGVWFGPKKPKNISLVLQPVIDKIKILSDKGISAHTPAGLKTIRAMLLAGIFDLPAKAMVLNTVQFNGNFGCNYCIDRGININPGQHVYPPDDSHTLRSGLNMKEWANQAESTGEHVFGVKGNSVLSGVVNIPFGAPIDYMHAVLEGVTKMFLKCWFNTKHHDKPYYLKPYVADIDKAIARIKPPHEFQRSPRSIESSLHLWKASEYRAFLLFYSVPVLKSFLPSEYIYHFSLLVYGMHVLLGRSIAVEDLPLVETLLQLFYTLTPKLYGNELCTANMHSLIHLVMFVKLWGPLWSHSTFPFENVNGILVRQFHGTRNVLLQMVFVMKVRQLLSFQCNETSLLQQLTPNSFVVGRVYKKNIPNTLVQLLGCTCTSIQVFTRVRINGITYYSQEQEKSAGAKSSSIVCYTDDGPLSFGCINFYFFYNNQPLALIDKFTVMEDGILDDIDSPRLETLMRANKILDRFFIKVKKLSLTNEILTIPISSIVRKCVLIPVKGHEWSYIILLPNVIERH